MSDESLLGKEDKENLLYIAKGIHVEELSIGEDHVFLRESVASEESEISIERIGSDRNILSKLPKLGPEVLNDPNIIVRTRPFNLKWSFGMNPRVRIKNLRTEEKDQLLFASAHFPIIYDNSKRSIVHLEGHCNVIKEVSCNKNGRWIITVGSGSQGNLMVWENANEQISVVRTIFEPYPYEGVETIEISESARYLITVGSISESQYSVDFWLWTQGKDGPNDSYCVPATYGKPVRVCFNPDVEEHIMLIFEQAVFLMGWDPKADKLSNVVIPPVFHKKKIGLFTDGTYISHCHECYASSNKGCISVFGNTLYPKPFDEGDLDNSKIFRNAVKVSTGSIFCCTTTEDIIVTADCKGVIQFFDKKIRILYWLNDFNFGPVLSISFSLSSKFIFKGKNKFVIRKPIIERNYENDFEDITNEIEILTRKDLPETATLTKEPFYVQDFLVATASSNIFMVDCVAKTCKPVFPLADGYVTAIETHDEHHYLLIGYSSGTILLKDYENHITISKLSLPETEQKKNAITCIKYCLESFHLVCGRENGEIWVLEPILLTPKSRKPFTVTGDAVVKIDFSDCPIQFAYYDTNRTVVLFAFDLETSKWKMVGKLRPHYDEINDIMFMPGNPNSRLYTISKDRYIVEYNNGTLKDGQFEILSRDRIDQSAVPVCMTYWYESSLDKAYLFISDSKYKMKILYQSTKIPKTLVLGPAYGCFKDDFIRKMIIVPGSDLRYMVFSTTKHLGLHILPPDGNPYKYVGYLAHPNGLVDFKLSNDGQFVFSFAENDAFVFKWEIRPRGVEIMHVLGGKELEPFYCLIEGGASGSLFQEIRDLFYYMQILQQENMDMPRRVLDTISVTEIPDLVRSCGFYPSEFELENMMIDIRYRNFDDNQRTNDEVSFIDFVKLYCNHKPAYGYSLKDVEKAFTLLATNSEEYVSDDVLNKEEMLNILTSSGEIMSWNGVFKCLKTLLRNFDEEESFDFLPDNISFEFFREEILGVDMLRDKFQEGGDSDRSWDISFDDVSTKQKD